MEFLAFVCLLFSLKEVAIQKNASVFTDERKPERRTHRKATLREK